MPAPQHCSGERGSWVCALTGAHHPDVRDAARRRHHGAPRRGHPGRRPGLRAPRPVPACLPHHGGGGRGRGGGAREGGAPVYYAQLVKEVSRTTGITLTRGCTDERCVSLTIQPTSSSHGKQNSLLFGKHFSLRCFELWKTRPVFATSTCGRKAQIACVQPKLKGQPAEPGRRSCPGRLLHQQYAVLISRS